MPLREDVLRLHGKLKDLALTVHVPEPNVLGLVAGIETMTDEQLVVMFDGLRHIRDHEYAVVHQIYNLAHITPAMWEHYYVAKLTQIPEYKKLRAAARELKFALAALKRTVRALRPKRARQTVEAVVNA